MAQFATGYGGLTEGLESGLRLGSDLRSSRITNDLNARRVKLEEDRFKREGLQREENLKEQQEQGIRDKLIAQVSSSSELMTNTNWPSSLKLREYNDVYAPSMEKLYGVKLPRLTEWNAEVGKYTKQITNIMSDASLSDEQKQKGVMTVMAEAKGNKDVMAVAGESMKQIEASQLKASKRNEIEALGILNKKSQGYKTQDSDAKTINRIRQTNPEALLNATKFSLQHKEKKGSLKTVDLAIKAANVPSDIDKMTPDDAAKVLNVLKNQGIGIEDFIGILQQRKGQGFVRKLFGKLFGGGGNTQPASVSPQSKPQIKVVKSPAAPTTPTAPAVKGANPGGFTEKDQEVLNNILGNQ